MTLPARRPLAAALLSLLAVACTPSQPPKLSLKDQLWSDPRALAAVEPLRGTWQGDSHQPYGDLTWRTTLTIDRGRLHQHEAVLGG